MKRSIIAAVVTAGVVLTACGGSQQDKPVSQGASQQEKAVSQVCAARADIKKQLDTLSGMTASTVTLDGVKSNLQSIGDDVKQITSAQDNLSSDRKQQVQQASSAFKSAVQNVGASLLKSISTSQAKQQLNSAATQLQTSYKQALALIDCSG